MNLGPYSKTITALVTGLLGWGAVAITSEARAVTASEWLALGVAVATALGVYAVPNGPAQVQVVNPPEDPANVAEVPRRNRPLRIRDRGAADMGSIAVGILIGLLFGYLLWGAT